MSSSALVGDVLADPWVMVPPAFVSHPRYASTLGPEVADLADLAGMTPDPEQRLALDLIFALDERGGPAAFEVALIACRQNLKTAVFKMAALGWLFLTDERLIVWSAHEFKTAIESFRDMRELIEGCPALMRRNPRFYTSSGNEAIEVDGPPRPDGTVPTYRMIFRARTGSSGRGLSGDKMVLDEAFAVTAAQMGSLLPTLSARPNPQIVYGSSAGRVSSTILRSLRDRGRRGNAGRLAYLEWCSRQSCAVESCRHAPGAPGCALDRVSAWREANTALGRRITVASVRAERAALEAVPWEFARERLGWWDDPGVSEVFGVGRWEGAARAEVAGVPLAAVGVGVSRDLTRAGVSGVGLAGDVMVVKPLKSAPGIGWVVESVKALQSETGCRVVVDERGPAAVLMSRLAEEGVQLTLPSAREVFDACAATWQGVYEGRVRHGDYPELNAAVNAASQRNVGDRWTWTTKDDGEDITLLWGVTLAVGAVSAGPAETSYYETNRLDVI